MSKMPLEFEAEMEETYDSLISLIENNQGRLCLIIVGCDQVRLRERVIERYERDAKEVKIRPYRIMLGSEPSVRAGLDRTFSQEAYLQEGGEAVFSVLGADTLLRVKLRDEDEQSEIEKFFGYLQWTREGMREFRYPIVLWVSIRILRDMGRRAPDFWSWRKASFQFGEEDERLAAISREPIGVSNSFQDEGEFFPPLDELLQELKELQKRDPDSPNLPTLYSKIAKLYTDRIRSGESKDLKFERSTAIEYFEKAIDGMRAIGEDIEYVDNLNSLGSLLMDQCNFTEAAGIFQTALEFSQSNNLQLYVAESLMGIGGIYQCISDYEEAINCYRQSLEIYRDLGREIKIAECLHNLGNSFGTLEKHQKTIDYYSQSIEISRANGNRRNEAASLTNLGHCYSSIGQHEKAIAIIEQALSTHREFKDRLFEIVSLKNLGFAHNAIGNPQKTFDYYKEAVCISQMVGERYQEADALFCMAQALAKLDRSFEALQTYQQAQTIFEEISLKYKIKECKDVIRQLNRVVPAQSIRANPTPEIPKRQSKKKSISQDEKVFFGFTAGITIALLIWWFARR